MIKRILCRLCVPSLLAVAVVLVYGHTLDVPWYLDDIHAIVDNERIRGLFLAFERVLSLRGVSNVTFAMNYAAHGLDIAGYHLVNILLHYLAGVVVYALLVRHLRFSSGVSLLGALFFLLHPLQTQAVTYVVQRMSLLSGIFTLLSVFLICESYRLYRERQCFFDYRHLSLYGAAFLFWGAGVLSKENAAMAPVLMLLTLVCISEPSAREGVRQRAKYLLPFFVCMAVAAIAVVLVPLMQGRSLVDMANVRPSLSNEGRTPFNYFMTQWSVVFVYLRLFLLPIQQKLEYAYPLTQTFFAWKPLVSLLGLSLLGYVILRLKESRPWFFYGMLWFFASLVVESSLIPLDPLFEHRMYLPMFGLSVALLGVSVPTGSFVGAKKQQGGRMLAIGLIVSVLAVTAWWRNDLWREPVKFSLADAQRSPHSEGAWVSLSKRYLDVDDLSAAGAALNKALAINPKYSRIYPNLSSLYIRKGMYREAEMAIAQGLQLAPGNRLLLKNRGLLFTVTGRSAAAIRVLRPLVKSSSNDSTAYALLGINYNQLQDWAKAEQALRKALEINPLDSQALYQLGISQFSRGRYDEAQTYFEQATRLSPDNGEYLYGLGMVLLARKDHESLAQVISRLRSVAPNLARELQFAMRAE